MSEDRPVCDRAVETVGERVLIRDEYGKSEWQDLKDVNPRRLWRWLRWKSDNWRIG